MSKRLITLVLVLAALALPASALATPPATETMHVDETFVLAPGTAENPCTFDVTYRNTGTFVITTHFDADGTAVRMFARGSDFLEEYSANGKVLSSRSPASVHFDSATGTLVGTGNQRHFVVPGLGLVYAQAGRLVLDTATRPTPSGFGLDVPQGAGFCAALSA